MGPVPNFAGRGVKKPFYRPMPPNPPTDFVIAKYNSARRRGRENIAGLSNFASSLHRVWFRELDSIFAAVAQEKPRIRSETLAMPTLTGGSRVACK